MPHGSDASRNRAALARSGAAGAGDDGAAARPAAAAAVGTVADRPSRARREGYRHDRRRTAPRCDCPYRCRFGGAACPVARLPVAAHEIADAVIAVAGAGPGPGSRIAGGRSRSDRYFLCSAPRSRSMCPARCCSASRRCCGLQPGFMPRRTARQIRTPVASRRGGCSRSPATSASSWPPTLQASTCSSPWAVFRPTASSRTMAPQAHGVQAPCMWPSPCWARPAC